MSCRGFLKCALKLFNLVLTFLGVAIILYSIWMLKRWHPHSNRPLAPAPAPAPDGATPLEENLFLPSVGVASLSSSQVEALANSGDANEKNPNLQLESSGLEVPQLGRTLLQRELSSSGYLLVERLPASWFIYGVLSLGVIVCLIAFSGHIAIETTNGCCLSCYTVCVCFLLLLEAAIVAYGSLNHHWEQDIPDDPTGQFANLKKFVEENLDICKWLGLIVVVAEAFVVLFALILRALGPDPRRSGYESDDDYMPYRPGLHQSLLNRQAPQGAVGSSGNAEARSSRTDAWTTRMRDKYGLDASEFSYNPTDSKRFSQQGAAATEESDRRCTVM